MPKVLYVKRKFSATKAKIINKANELIADYQAQGYRLTLRQLFYRFVAGDWFPEEWADPVSGSKNNQKNYGKLGDILGDARMAGLVDWNAIEDRTREISAVPHWDSPADIVAACERSFRLDKWNNQPYRIEVWVEKDALEGIVTQAAHAADVAAFSCRGYSSLSSLWEASQRLKAYVMAGQRPIILHLGDRLNTFVVQDWLNEMMGPKLKKTGGSTSATRGDIWTDIEKHFTDKYPSVMLETSQKPIRIRRIALNMAQVEEYNPPPNPAKSSDSRFKKYVEEHGDESWELDALEPSVLDALITETIDEYRRPAEFNARAAEEKKHRANLKTAATHWNGKLATVLETLK